jgi:two-component system NtrC family response regulator
MSEHTILLVDDDPSLLRVTEFQLQSGGYNVITATDGKEGLSTFREQKPDIVITDIKMPVMDGVALLSEIKRISPNTIIIMITAHGSIETAIQAMKTGAFDYICKPFEKDEFLVTVERAIDHLHLMNENHHLHEELLSRFSFENIVSGSEAMNKIFTMIRRVSQTDSSVLLHGESGTGKELIARAVHYSSPRQKKPFVAVNCAAIPETLMESEFFGHVKGSFTGALHDRAGKFEQANGGTIFLDEIGDMRMDLQSKLLRVLQEHEIERVGGTKSIHIDVRVIAATNKDLREMVNQNHFREDLYYRLNVIPIRLPALRERKDDIPLLIQHFLRELGGSHVTVDSLVYNQLQLYDWPGNVRELQNIIEQAFVLRQHDDRLTVEDMPDFISGISAGNSKLFMDIPPEGIVLDEVEKDLIQLALQKTKGNQNQAAKLLGITRQTLIYRMKKYDIQ